MLLAISVQKLAANSKFREAGGSSGRVAVTWIWEATSNRSSREVRPGRFGKLELLLTARMSSLRDPFAGLVLGWGHVGNEARSLSLTVVVRERVKYLVNCLLFCLGTKLVNSAAQVAAPLTTNNLRKRS